MVENIELASLDAAVSMRYAEIRAQLARKGTPIGANHYRIAAQSLALGATLVTDNGGEFNRVPGLHTENWLRPEGAE